LKNRSRLNGSLDRLSLHLRQQTLCPSQIRDKTAFGYVTNHFDLNRLQ
jgi:hypothetical protein